MGLDLCSKCYDIMLGGMYSIVVSSIGGWRLAGGRGKKLYVLLSLRDLAYTYITIRYGRIHSCG